MIRAYRLFLASWIVRMLQKEKVSGITKKQWMPPSLKYPMKRMQFQMNFKYKGRFPFQKTVITSSFLYGSALVQLSQKQKWLKWKYGATKTGLRLRLKPTRNLLTELSVPKANM